MVGNINFLFFAVIIFLDEQNDMNVENITIPGGIVQGHCFGIDLTTSQAKTTGPLKYPSS